MSRRHVLFAIQAAITIALLTVLFRRFDWDRFADVLARLSWRFYAASLLVVIIGQVTYAFRWKTILDGLGVRVGYGEALRQYLIGLFFTNVMPTAVGGDAAKVYLLGRRAGFLEIGASVVVDRLLGFLWLAVFGAALAWALPADSPILVLNRQLLTLFAAILAAVLLASRFLSVPALLGPVTARWPGAADQAASFGVLVRRGMLTGRALAVSAGVVALYMWLITLVYQSHFATNGVGAVSAPMVMLGIISMSIFVNVPISVNGIGLREQLHALLFSAMGVPTEVAVSISLLLFAHALVVSLAGAVLWFRVKRA